MTVFRKKLKNGKFADVYHYSFFLNKKRYQGSTYKETEKEAKKYEEELKKDLQSVVDVKSKSEQAKSRTLLNLQEKMTEELKGPSIPLVEVWELFRKIGPPAMRRQPNERGWKVKEMYWNDFLSFLNSEHPSVQTLRDVIPEHASEYVGHLKTKGKFCKTITYNGREYNNKMTKLAPSTINEYIKQIKQVFTILFKKASLIENPFEKIPLVDRKSQGRFVFEIDELTKINQYLDEQRQLYESSEVPSRAKLDFIVNEAIFIIGINSGLRRGDICLLEWTDVKFPKKFISKISSKTGEHVTIPMTGSLYEFLQRKNKTKINKYVTPELASMYLENADGTTYRFKKMLENLGIETQKVYRGRSRQTSIKDIHALRHTFCYLHGFQGTPMVVLQNMVGHLSDKMTESYALHKTEQAKKEAIKRFAMGNIIPDSLMNIKQEAIDLINSCEDREKIQSCIDCFKTISIQNAENQSEDQFKIKPF
ncbi:MAG: tyrosine-type recombinase/integrase [Lentisphaeraceae bacterium]|nr:tyrosine-type recombinase/integrase [Lentisphaeraceae bacterium]